VHVARVETTHPPPPPAQYPDDEAALGEAIDALLDNPDFLDLVADEIMFQVRGHQPTYWLTANVLSIKAC
jgi:hypothetical protein